MTATEKQSKEAAVQQAVDSLREHFESVQIMTSTVDDASTFCVKKGSGDWYSRVGMAREFLIEDDQGSRLNVSRDRRPPEEGPESWQFL